MLIGLAILVLGALAIYGAKRYLHALSWGADIGKIVLKRIDDGVRGVIEDDDMPEDWVRNLAILGSSAGCGCLAGAMIRGTLNGHLRKSFERPSRTREMSSLTEAQRKLVSSLIMDLILYDCLRSPIIRKIVTRLIWFVPSLTEHKRTADLSEDQAKVITEVAKEKAWRYKPDLVPC